MDFDSQIYAKSALIEWLKPIILNLINECKKINENSITIEIFEKVFGE